MNPPAKTRGLTVGELRLKLKGIPPWMVVAIEGGEVKFHSPIKQKQKPVLEKHRLAFALYCKGMRQKEIGEKLGMSRQAVNSAVRTLEKLEKLK